MTALETLCVVLKLRLEEDLESESHLREYTLPLLRHPRTQRFKRAYSAT